MRPTQFYWQVLQRAGKNAAEEAHKVHFWIIIAVGAALTFFSWKLEEGVPLIIALPFLTLVILFFLWLFPHAYRLYKEEYDKRVALEARLSAHQATAYASAASRERRFRLHQCISKGRELMEGQSSRPELIMSFMVDSQGWIAEAGTLVGRDFPEGVQEFGATEKWLTGNEADRRKMWVTRILTLLDNLRTALD